MSGTGRATGGRSLTQLIIVADGEPYADAVCAWLADQLSDTSPERVTGYYAAVTALGAGAPIIVMDAAVSTPRDEWQLAQLRTHCEAATVIVVGEQPRRGALAGAVHADLEVPNVSDLPPLRELVTGPAPVARSTRRTAKPPVAESPD